MGNLNAKFTERSPIQNNLKSTAVLPFLCNHAEKHTECVNETINNPFFTKQREECGLLLTPRKPSLLFVMDSSSRGCILASTNKVSPLGSCITSSSTSTGGVIPKNTAGLVWGYSYTLPEILQKCEGAKELEWK